MEPVWMNPQKTAPMEGEDIEVRIQLAVSGERIYRGVFVNGQVWGKKFKLMSRFAWAAHWHTGWRRLCDY